MTATQDFALLDAFTISAAGVTLPVAIGSDRSVGRVSVDVMLSSGSCEVILETSASAADRWSALWSSGPLEGVQSRGAFLIGLGARVRARYVPIAGVSTLSVRGQSYQLFCTGDDIARFSLPPAAMTSFTAEDKAQASLSATDEAASYMGVGFDMPLVSWGSALRMHTANIAAYHLLRRRGFNPDNPTDSAVRDGYTDAIKWLQGPVRSDSSITDSTPGAVPDGAYIVSQPPRGWVPF